MFELTVTFDNGPEPSVTPQVLDVLARHGVASTFFVIGGKLLNPQARACAQRAHSEGDQQMALTICNSICMYVLCVSCKLIAISEAAKLLGVHADTLRRWEREGKIKPRRTSGNLRRYDIADIRPDLIHAAPTASRKTVAYARVSSHDQKEDLERQKQVLESHCAAQGWTFELVADLGSGMNYRKRGLQKLLNQIIAGDVGRIVLNHKDRLLRFGAELVFAHL